MHRQQIQRDKANLDITWIKDESLEELENLPEPEILAAEIIENLEDALEQFRAIQETLEEGRGLQHFLKRHIMVPE